MNVARSGTSTDLIIKMLGTEGLKGKSCKLWLRDSSMQMNIGLGNLAGPLML